MEAISIGLYRKVLAVDKSTRWGARRRQSLEEVRRVDEGVILKVEDLTEVH